MMATINGDNNQNILAGTQGHDQINGFGDDDLLVGHAGNDTLSGGAGADYLDGRSGLDFADYRGSTAVLVDLANNNAVGGEAFGDTFVSIEGVLGSNFQDWIIGDANFNVFYGREGNDLLQGGGGGDLLYGGDGEDTLEGQDGNDDLVGGAGGDAFFGGAGIDVVSYLDSPSGVVVNLGANTAAGGHAFGDTFDSIENLLGSFFQDWLVGDANDNQIVGEGGHDALEGRGGNDTIFGSGLLSGGAGIDRLFAGPGDDDLSGGSGQDLLSGSNGADTLDGGGGRDELIGGTGRDVMVGGANHDTFTYWYTIDSPVGARTQDVIRDFSQAEGDRIDVEFVDAIPGAPDEEFVDDAFVFIGTAGFSGTPGELRYRITKNGVTFVQANTDGDATADMQIKFLGEIDFTAGDFIL